MKHDGELRLAFSRIAQVRKQLEEKGYAEELSELVDVLQIQEHAARVAYYRAMQRKIRRGCA